MPDWISVKDRLPEPPARRGRMTLAQPGRRANKAQLDLKARKDPQENVIVLLSQVGFGLIHMTKVPVDGKLDLPFINH